jgi:hypothetical protein
MSITHTNANHTQRPSKFEEQPPPPLDSSDNRWKQFDTGKELEEESWRASASAIANAAAVYAERLALVDTSTVGSRSTRRSSVRSMGDTVDGMEGVSNRSYRSLDSAPAGELDVSSFSNVVRRKSAQSAKRGSFHSQPSSYPRGYRSMSLDLQDAELSKLGPARTYSQEEDDDDYENPDPDGEYNIVYDFERSKILLAKLDEMSLENSVDSSSRTSRSGRGRGPLPYAKRSSLDWNKGGDQEDGGDRKGRRGAGGSRNIPKHFLRGSTITTRSEMMVESNNQMSELTMMDAMPSENILLDGNGGGSGADDDGGDDRIRHISELLSAQTKQKSEEHDVKSQMPVRNLEPSNPSFDQSDGGEKDGIIAESDSHVESDDHTTCGDSESMDIQHTIDLLLQSRRMRKDKIAFMESSEFEDDNASCSSRGDSSSVASQDSEEKSESNSEAPAELSPQQEIEGDDSSQDASSVQDAHDVVSEKSLLSSFRLAGAAAATTTRGEMNAFNAFADSDSDSDGDRDCGMSLPSDNNCTDEGGQSEDESSSVGISINPYETLELSNDSADDSNIHADKASKEQPQAKTGMITTVSYQHLDKDFFKDEERAGDDLSGDGGADSEASGLVPIHENNDEVVRNEIISMGQEQDPSNQKMLVDGNVHIPNIDQTQKSRASVSDDSQSANSGKEGSLIYGPLNTSATFADTQMHKYGEDGGSDDESLNSFFLGGYDGDGYGYGAHSKSDSSSSQSEPIDSSDSGRSPEMGDNASQSTAGEVPTVGFTAYYYRDSVEDLNQGLAEDTSNQNIEFDDLVPAVSQQAIFERDAILGANVDASRFSLLRPESHRKSFLSTITEESMSRCESDNLGVDESALNESSLKQRILSQINVKEDDGSHHAGQAFSGERSESLHVAVEKEGGADGDNFARTATSSQGDSSSSKDSISSTKKMEIACFDDASRESLTEQLADDDDSDGSFMPWPSKIPTNSSQQDSDAFKMNGGSKTEPKSTNSNVEKLKDSKKNIWPLSRLFSKPSSENLTKTVNDSTVQKKGGANNELDKVTEENKCCEDGAESLGDESDKNHEVGPFRAKDDNEIHSMSLDSMSDANDSLIRDRGGEFGESDSASSVAGSPSGSGDDNVSSSREEGSVTRGISNSEHDDNGSANSWPVPATPVSQDEDTQEEFLPTVSNKEEYRQDFASTKSEHDDDGNVTPWLVPTSPVSQDEDTQEEFLPTVSNKEENRQDFASTKSEHDDGGNAMPWSVPTSPVSQDEDEQEEFLPTVSNKEENRQDFASTKSEHDDGGNAMPWSVPSSPVSQDEDEQEEFLPTASHHKEENRQDFASTKSEHDGGGDAIPWSVPTPPVSQDEDEQEEFLPTASHHKEENKKVIDITHPMELGSVELQSLEKVNSSSVASSSPNSNSKQVVYNIQVSDSDGLTQLKKLNASDLFYATGEKDENSDLESEVEIDEHDAAKNENDMDSRLESPYISNQNIEGDEIFSHADPDDQSSYDSSDNNEEDVLSLSSEEDAVPGSSSIVSYDSNSESEDECSIFTMRSSTVVSTKQSYDSNSESEDECSIFTLRSPTVVSTKQPVSEPALEATKHECMKEECLPIASPQPFNFLISQQAETSENAETGNNMQGISDEKLNCATRTDDFEYGTNKVSWSSRNYHQEISDEPPNAVASSQKQSTRSMSINSDDKKESSSVQISDASVQSESILEETDTQARNSRLFQRNEEDNECGNSDIETGLKLSSKNEIAPLVRNMRSVSIRRHEPRASRCTKITSVMVIFASILALTISVVILFEKQKSPPLLFTDEGILPSPPVGSGNDVRFENKVWLEHASIAAPRESLDDLSGYAIAISGDGTRLVVGGKDFSSDSLSKNGIVRIYKLTEGENKGSQEWQEITSMQGESSLDQFGSAVSLSADGHHLVVGAPGFDIAIDSETNEGKVYLYDISENNNNEWEIEVESFVGEKLNDQLGFSVSLDSNGDNLAIGAPKRDNARGVVFVYTKDPRSNWYQIGNILSGTNMYDQFGTSVSLALSGVYLVVGAPGDSTLGDRKGYVKVRTRQTYCELEPP